MNNLPKATVLFSSPNYTQLQFVPQFSQSLRKYLLSTYYKLVTTLNIRNRNASEADQSFSQNLHSRDERQKTTQQNNFRVVIVCQYDLLTVTVKSF